MQPFTIRVVEIIKGIPEGHVMTYGQIAALVGAREGLGRSCEYCTHLARRTACLGIVWLMEKGRLRCPKERAATCRSCIWSWKALHS